MDSCQSREIRLIHAIGTTHYDEPRLVPSKMTISHQKDLLLRYSEILSRSARVATQRGEECVRTGSGVHTQFERPVISALTTLLIPTPVNAGDLLILRAIKMGNFERVRVRPCTMQNQRQQAPKLPLILT